MNATEGGKVVKKDGVLFIFIVFVEHHTLVTGVCAPPSRAVGSHPLSFEDSCASLTQYAYEEREFLLTTVCINL